MTKQRGRTVDIVGLDSENTYVFARPVFSNMQTEAEMVEDLLFNQAGVAFTKNPNLRTVLDSAAHDDETKKHLAELFTTGTLEEVEQVFEDYEDFAGFRRFFNSRDEKRWITGKIRREQDLETQQKQMKMLLEAGLTEKGVLDLVRDFMQPTQTTTSPSLTVLPANMDGLENGS